MKKFRTPVLAVKTLHTDDCISNFDLKISKFNQFSSIYLE